MKYVDSTGTEHMNSYWALTDIDIRRRKTYGEFGWTGFHDRAAYESGYEPIGYYSFKVSGNEFLFWYLKHITEQIDIGKIAYMIAATRIDTPTTPRVENQIFPGNVVQQVKIPQFKHFFEGATDDI